MSLKVFLPEQPLSLLPPSKQFSMKQEIDINVAALKAYDAGDYDLALKTFEVRAIPDYGLTRRKLRILRASFSTWG